MKFFMKLLKEWGLFTLVLIAFIASQIFIWNSVTVEGHSMDPTLSDGEKLIMIKHTTISRFDIVVATETDSTTGQDKKIVKRVIGMPGDTIRYENDTLYINGEEFEETYLTDYFSKFQDDQLQSTYSYNAYFQELAKNSNAFTTDSNGSADFTVTVGEGEYFLMGDDRIVSSDSRQVGTFSADSIIGEIKLSFWPLTNFKLF